MNPLLFILGLALVVVPCAGFPAGNNDIDDLRDQINQMKQDYEQRIQALEDRLQQAETQAQDAQLHAKSAEASANAMATAPVINPPSTANAFNPAIGVILDAKARYFSQDTNAFSIPGFSLPEESSIGSEGLSLGESELNFSGNIDDKFYGSLTVALVEEDSETEVELEEAYIQTLALPAGLILKGGRFFSNIGYLNPKHSHTDDFADRSLPYRAFLNNQFIDDGVQLLWIAPTDLLVEVGGELLRGAGYPAGGASNDGKGAWTVFSHVGGDVGLSSSWRAGFSYISAEADDRDSGDPDNPDLFTGDSDLWVADFIWKWAPNGNPVNQNFKLQGEYFFLAEDGQFTPAGGSRLPLSTDQNGFYVQAVYQFIPQWRAGIRYSQLDADDPGPAIAGTSLDTQGHTPWILSAMLDWSNSEFSRFRLQYNRDESSLQPDDQLVLQYIMSLGAHGAHQF
jgi:hypothetical protein